AGARDHREREEARTNDVAQRLEAPDGLADALEPAIGSNRVQRKFTARRHERIPLVLDSPPRQTSPPNGQLTVRGWHGQVLELGGRAKPTHKVPPRILAPGKTDLDRRERNAKTRDRVAKFGQNPSLSPRETALLDDAGRDHRRVRPVRDGR